jgi:hypothetical protein
LRDAGEIQRARVFPYQLLTSYRNCDAAVPEEVRNALQDAMELSIANVPPVDGDVVVCPDVSGSMSSPVTGHRAGATSSVRCIDVAALVAASVLRKNQAATVLPFEQAVVSVDLNSRDSVMTNARRLASIGGGGTNCSAPVRLLNERKAKADLVIFISDNQSWVEHRLDGGPWPGDRVVGRVAGIPAAESEGSSGLSGYPAELHDASCRTGGHPEHRGIFRSGNSRRTTGSRVSKQSLFEAGGGRMPAAP